MPLIIKSIHSFSSEDSSFPATNLLSSTPSTTKKWKCKLAGEPSIQVVLQLENPSTITGIDIGNEHSAFVDVSVSKSGSSDFKQILLLSSFMTAVESRNSDPVNRVRCFTKSALVAEVVESKCKWDLVKITCTQPFNKHVQYGLSFITLHSSDAKDSNEAATSIPLKVFHNFKIREESPDSESETSQSLFARWKASRSDSDAKEQSHSIPLSAAAAIRNASTTTSLKTHSPQVNRMMITPKRVQNRHNISDQLDEDNMIQKKRNRSELMYEDEDDKPNEKLDKIILKEKERLDREKNEKRNSEKKQSKNKNTSEISKRDGPTYAMATTSKMSRNDDKLSEMNDLKVDNKNDRPATSSNTNKKRQSSPISVPVVKRMKESKEPVYKPFHKLLEGVVLAISGIQNPTRAMIRQQAMVMGAKYKPDWEASCTHLICAFKNTPKYNQVHEIGKIITKDWISECHKKKTRLPWRRFALDDADAEASESEDEIYDNSLKPSQSSSDSKKGPEYDIKHQKHSTSPQKLSQSKSPSTSPSKISRFPIKSAIDLSDDSDNESFDRYNLNSSRVERNNFVSSGSDTEDEIKSVIKSKSSDDIFNATTEEDTSVREETSKTVTPLPEFFKGKQFYLSRNISSTDEIKLKRFISIYGGEVTAAASDSDYIVSNSPKQTPAEYKGEVVKPLWIFECNDLEMLLPTQRYNFSNW